MNWRGLSPRDLATIISLIAATMTAAGLKAHHWLDETFRRKGIKVTQEENDAPDLRRDAFRGERNYTLPVRPEADDDAIIS